MAETHAPTCTQHRAVTSLLRWHPALPLSLAPNPALPPHAPKPGSRESRKDTAAVSEPPRASPVGRRRAAERLRHRRDWRRAHGEPASCSPARPPAPGSTTPSNQPLQLQGPRCSSSIRPRPFPLPRQLQSPFLQGWSGNLLRQPLQHLQVWAQSCLLTTLAVQARFRPSQAVF